MLQGSDRLMRVLVATDAWHPQVNGVVRTLMALAESVCKQGVTIVFLTPEGLPSVRVPTYPGCDAHCLARERSRGGSSKQGPMQFTLPPKGRLGTWCDAIAANIACRSRRATRH